MKYLKTYEGNETSIFYKQDEVKNIFTPLIRWDVISDVKEISLEYLDYGMDLIIEIHDSASGSRIYDYIVNHIEEGDRWYSNSFYNEKEISYQFLIVKNKNKYIKGKETNELNKIIRLEYPDINNSTRKY